MTNKIKEPLIKAGGRAKDYNGHEYKVLKVSNEYNEVSNYDTNHMCAEYSTEEQLYNIGLDPEDVLYCAVENANIETLKANQLVRTHVFLISRDSKILGE